MLANLEPPSADITPIYMDGVEYNMSITSFQPTLYFAIGKKF